MKDYRPGLTAASLFAILLGLLLTGMLTQWSQVLLNLTHPPEQTLAVPAVVVILALLVISGLGYLAFKRHLLSRAELLCVFFAMLFGAPLMTQAFWHRIIAITGTIPRANDFEKMDAFNDKLWPHGDNLLANGLAESQAAPLRFTGQHAYEETEYEAGQHARLLVLRNEKQTDVAAVRFPLPALRAGQTFILPNSPYLISVLLRPENLGGDSYYYCRISYDDATSYEEVFRDTAPAKRSFAHQKGFLRMGAYGVKFSPRLKQLAWLEFGLRGPGRLALWDPKLFSVEALETAYTGRQVIQRSAYDQLPLAERAGLIVKPDQMWSLAGLKFILAGYIPWDAWWRPLSTWSAFFGLILLGTLAVCVIMRKQWAENERFPFPVTKIASAWFGEGEPEDRAFAAIWANKLMWTGFGVSLAWCLIRGWHFYNPKVPDLSVVVPLQPYFNNPDWGGMWGITFQVRAIFLALAMFMELNVLLSLVLGFFLWRSLLWLGYVFGWNAHVDFPYGAHQSMASYITYAVLIVIFTRKYLWRVLRAAVTGDREASRGEMVSYRTAFLLLLLSFVGASLWGWWVGISPLGVALYFGFMVLAGFVGAKFRAECGAPFGYFSPYYTWLFITLVGGLSVFGASGVLVFLIASFMLTETVFFLIPGAQLEFAELGRRFAVQPRHLFYTAVIGVVGGMVLGGWAFLSNAYALGGETVRYQWAFDSKYWYFNQYNAAVNEATGKMLGQASGAAPAHSGLDAATWAYLYAAGGTAIVTILRQLFAGFWFHPFGFIMSSSRLMEHYVWGSCLAAWVVRGLVLKVGGAATVKNKLVPFFIGVFLAGSLSYIIWGVYGTYLSSHNINVIYGELP